MKQLTESKTTEHTFGQLHQVARKKAELQSQGIRIPPELLPELEARYNAPAIKTGRMVLCLESPARDRELIPVFIVNGKRADTSPFHLVKNMNNQFEVYFENEKYTDIVLLPRPGFYDLTTEYGTPMYKVAVIVGPGHMRSVVHNKCHYQQIGKPCRFCAVQRWWDASMEKALPEIAQTVEAGVKEGIVKHISLTSGTLNTSCKGLEDLVETARLISERVTIPIMLEFEPPADLSLLDSLLEKARNAGITTVSCNIECFDEKLRPQIMPAKGTIPIDTYVKTWGKCLSVFGKNNVFTVAVVGIGEDDNSIIRGVKMAAEHGIMTFLVPHSPAIGAVYENMNAPSAARLISLYWQAAEIYEKHGLDLCASKAGCVRGGGFSAIKDVARFGI